MLRRFDAESYFSAIQRLVEERILKAQAEGVFDNLPGKGKPLRFEPNPPVNSSLRVSFKILRNAGILPPELALRREIRDLRDLLSHVDDEGELRELVKELNEKILAFNVMSGRSMAGEIQQLYGEKVIEKLKSRRAQYYLETLSGEKNQNKF
jgi:DnaJ homologue, subfamily C, member 28, conserved domain